MKNLPSSALAAGLSALLLSGCYDVGPGYGGYGGYYSANYYEPYGAYYGGWGPNYYVAPFPDRRRFLHPHDIDRHPHAFRSAPNGRAVPSIPSQARPSPGGHGGPRGGDGHDHHR